VGPIGVAEHLVKFLPGHVFAEKKDGNNINAVAAAPYGSALILPISYGYIKMLGADGLRESTRMAILNANYLKSALDGHYKILYTGSKGRVAHEFILDCNQYLKTADITVVNIAKRLMDYGFHAPTVAFPVPGTLMVEPTESEPLQELDRFIEAMVAIRQEIADIEQGKAERGNNVLSNAPHTIQMVMLDKWDKPYDRQRAALPVAGLHLAKYWPPVTHIDDAYGDRNLVCTCEPLESYVEVP
jgi:glycine dehydrogenase